MQIDELYAANYNIYHTGSIYSVSLCTVLVCLQCGSDYTVGKHTVWVYLHCGSIKKCASLHTWSIYSVCLSTVLVYLQCGSIHAVGLSTLWVYQHCGSINPVGLSTLSKSCFFYWIKDGSTRTCREKKPKINFVAFPTMERSCFASARLLLMKRMLHSLQSHLGKF